MSMNIDIAHVVEAVVTGGAYKDAATNNRLPQGTTLEQYAGELQKLPSFEEMKNKGALPPGIDQQQYQWARDTYVGMPAEARARVSFDDHLKAHATTLAQPAPGGPPGRTVGDLWSAQGDMRALQAKGVLPKDMVVSQYLDLTDRARPEFSSLVRSGQAPVGTTYEGFLKDKVVEGMRPEYSSLARSGQIPPGLSFEQYVASKGVSTGSAGPADSSKPPAIPAG